MNPLRVAAVFRRIVAQFRRDPRSLAKRAEAYVERMPLAISGQGGHDATFNVARKLVQDFALSEGQAWSILLRYNTRCQPPWSERELKHKLAEAGRARVRNPVQDRDAPRHR